MRQPPGFEIEGKDHLVCLLNKSFYGLKQAARSWNEAIHKVLSDAQFLQSKVDPCLYSKKEHNEWCFIIIYVDDMVVASRSKHLIRSTEKIVSSKFQMKNMGNIKSFLGLDIDKDKKGNYHLNQRNYIEQIAKDFGLADSKPSNIPMDPSYGKHAEQSEVLIDKDKYQKLIGCLLFVSVNTRPDISASVSILAQKVSQPTQNDWNELKRILKYLKATSKMKLSLSKDDDGEFFYGYADANWAEDRNSRKSNSGYVFKVNGGVISWSCRKQTCVALSSTEAEFIALSEACQEASWIRRILNDMKQLITEPTIIFEDNQSCLKLIQEEHFSNRTKHIDTRYHFVKDFIKKQTVVCRYCPTESMLADLLTKPLGAGRHKMLRERCGLFE